MLAIRPTFRAAPRAMTRPLKIGLLTALLLSVGVVACTPGGVTQVFVTPTADSAAGQAPSRTGPAQAIATTVTPPPTSTETPTPQIPTPVRPQETTATPTVTAATSTISPTPKDWVGPYTFPENVNPLTGLAVDDPAALTLRPVAVKISNAPPIVRPQAGLGQADVVFEHYAEGGLTRFTALYLSQLPRRVGSIRSARLIDVEIPEMFESYLVYSGSSQGVRDHIEAANFTERAFYGVETGPPSYYRDTAIPVPHNLFADLVAVHELAASWGVNSPPAPAYSALAFAPQPPPGGVSATSIDLGYRGTRVQWRYDSERGLYLRWSDGQPHFDATIDQQVSAANVVVLFANHVEDMTIVESEWQGGRSYSIEIQLWEQGQAVFFRDGQRYEGTWERPDPVDMFALTDAEGEVLRLAPGVTFFQLVPLDFEGLAVE